MSCNHVLTSLPSTPTMPKGLCPRRGRGQEGGDVQDASPLSASAQEHSPLSEQQNVNASRSRNQLAIC